MVKNVIKDIENSRIFTKDEQLSMKLEGSFEKAVRFIERNQICDVGLWQKFVELFRWHEDGCGDAWVSWRSEYWGKMMRSAAMVVKYTNDDGMYKILENSVRDLLTTADKHGRISGYSVEQEFTHWDIWGRKYVMLGMFYFMEICRDEKLKDEMTYAIKRQADYMIERIGHGKLDIRECSSNWEGLNSCSVLEPIVRLYKLTGEQKYFEFAEYIISTGFIQSANIIELAFEDKVSPHEYPVVKAYEMMSCFEGLLQFYYVTGIEKYKTAILNFGKRIINGELSIIGCSGCTHELFDHTAVRQTQTDYEGVIQETCVTVTWMKFAAAVLELSGDVSFADCIEQSFYNAYAGSFNTQRIPSVRYRVPDREHIVPQVLPFDAYSPLVSNVRGRATGGFNYFPDGTFYGCCACIGGAGAGVIPQIAVMKSQNGIVLNFYEKGIIETSGIKLCVDTDYPYDGKITIELETAAKAFDITLRVPQWCDGASITVNGQSQPCHKGYVTLSRQWTDKDVIVLNLPMAVKRVLPPKEAVNCDIFAGYTYGPLVLAADKRITDPDAILDVVEGTQKAVYCPEIREAELCLEVTLANGEKARLIDYASAGKTWSEESRCAAWLKRRRVSADNSRLS